MKNLPLDNFELIYSLDTQHEGSNAWLMSRLSFHLRALEAGDIHNFWEMPPDWRCPCCSRDKAGIARLDGNNRLLCRIVSHHDHLYHELDLPSWVYTGDHLDRLVRFAPTSICQDCNVFDAALKRKIGETRPYFSFSPIEIAELARPFPNLPHDIKYASVQKIRAVHERAQPEVARMRAHLESLSRSEAK